MFGLSTLATRIAMGVIAVVLLLGFLQVRSCQKDRRAAQEAAMVKGQAEASIAAGAEATNTVAALMQSDDATRRTVEEGINAIRNAPEAERSLVAERSLCKLQLYRDNERCAAMRAAGAAGAGNSS